MLIPARDEEANLAACLETVLSQSCVAEVLVYDDHSADGTRAIIDSFAIRDARVRLAGTAPLPAGWCGKTFACSRLAAEASAPWLLFLDADARLEPLAVAGMVGEAKRRSATFLSCWPGLTMVSFWEKLLMPMLNFVVFSMYPAPLSLTRREPSLGLAHGACILVDKRTYDSVGGHTAVASEIFEDTRLAQVWRERGELSICLDGKDVVRVRMYRTPRQIWRGFQKNLRGAFKTELAFWAFLLVHALVFLYPFLALRRAALVVIAARLLLALRFHQPFWSALLHPVGEVFMLALGVASWWAWRGEGVLWKGRVYRRA
ncbi:MAG: glycosyl hydrolase [Bryobacterales bacterium]|nr:glycosyl hydrolase [Bryobacterales bacterium]